MNDILSQGTNTADWEAKEGSESHTEVLLSVNIKALIIR